EMWLSPVLVDRGAPSSDVVSHHALESAPVVSMHASVRIVLRYGCATQSVPAIVRRVSVAVVDHHRAPIAGHVQPGQLMCSVLRASDHDPPITVDVHCPSNVAGVNRSAHAPKPMKFSGLGVVTQNVAQPRARQSRTSSHGK